MPKSKSRTKKSKGKAWRTGRAGSEYEDGSDVGAQSGFDLPGMPDVADMLAGALDADEELYTDETLGRILINRGWAPVHVHYDDMSDTWAWQDSTPDGPTWVPTMVTVMEDCYLVQFVDDGKAASDNLVSYDSREELLDDIAVIELYRHPADPRR